MLESIALSAVHKGILFSLLAGLGSYLQGIRDGRINRGFLNLITEMTTALVVGFIVMYVGEWAGLANPLIYVLVLVFSNNSSETLTFFKELAKSIVSSKFKVQGK